MVKHLLAAIILAILLCVPAHAVEVDTDANNAVDITYGGTNAATAADARTNLDVPSKTGSGATGTWGVNITGTAATATLADNVTGPVAVANGGTGASDAATARENLGLTIGSSIPAPDGTGASGDWGINSTNVTGTIAVANGGTGATTAANARTNLGLTIGSDVQAYAAMLALWASFTDPGVTALLKWDDTANTFQYYAPTAWRLFYSGASSALTEMSLGAAYTLFQFNGPAAAPTAVSTLNWDPLIAPYGANPTTDAAGEIAVDTSAAPGSMLRWYGDAAYATPAYQSVSSTIKGCIATDDYPLWKFPYAITIKNVKVYVIGGTNVVGGLDECTGTNGVCSSVTAVDADITGTAGDEVSDDGGLTNAGIAAGNYIQWHTTSVSGTNTSVTITMYYTVDQVN